MNDAVPKPEMSEMLAQSLINRFKFISASALDSDDSRTLHKDTVNLLRSLLCEFPEFLCEHHYEFMGAISAQCIEMLNLVSCAYPRYMHMPDPMKSGPHIDMLPEIQQCPPISPVYVKMIHESRRVLPLLDCYLETGLPVKVLINVESYILTEDFDCCYIVPRINAIVLYVETQAIIHLQCKNMTLSISNIATTSWHSKFFYNLLNRLDDAGRPLLITAICNQLTYPNIHTQYFSCLIQYLFESTLGERTRREIASGILERVRIQPISWGLAYARAKLLKNPLFDSYADEFFHRSPVIQRSLSNLCILCVLAIVLCIKFHDINFATELYTLLIMLLMYFCVLFLLMSIIARIKKS
ncbi:hypothetical protein ACJMK2_041753 [Sinanodonta woodiana]|uniref:CCR4-Not complex component Not1 C-terminal domain-containing protein n=1 Tax=Sinanodonta woodiana TaxID=1069815 RepID=A0ABD3W8G0_SINWO